MKAFPYNARGPAPGQAMRGSVWVGQEAGRSVGKGLDKRLFYYSGGKLLGGQGFFGAESKTDPGVVVGGFLILVCL